MVLRYWSLQAIVQSLSHVRFFAAPWTAACQASRSSPSPGACSNSSSLNRWCEPTILSSVVPFSSCLPSFPASGSFLMSQLFASGGESIGALASASVLPMTIQGWFPLGLTGLISLQSKELSRVFSNTTVQKHQFFSAQPPLWSNSDSSVDKESACNAGAPGSIPGSGRSAGEGIAYPLKVAQAYSWASLVAQLVNNLPAIWETCGRSLGWEDLLEKGKNTQSTILAWRIPWTI